MTSVEQNTDHHGLNVMVVQTGARRGYVLPRMLEKAGCLHSFHTTAAFRQSGSLSARLARMLLPSRTATINRRTLHSIAPEKIFVNVRADIARVRAARRSGSAMQTRLAESHALGRCTIPRIDTAANVAFIVDDSGGPELMKALKARGIPIAVDIVVTPMAHEMTASAAKEWPNWKATTYSADERRRYLQMYEDVVSNADLIMYPSEGVLQGLRKLSNFDETRSAHVPYAVGAFEPLPPAPERGRVFFAGSDPVRKGLPYLAAAARQLAEQGYQYEFIIAGKIPADVQALDDCKDLTFLGHISKNEMAREMSRADVFCFPSLAEGTAGVTLEALSAGVPCIVTKSAGAPVVDRYNGVVVGEQNADDIATALVSVVEDRAFRTTLSRNAVLSRDNFTPATVQDKLVAALAGLLER